MRNFVFCLDGAAYNCYKNLPIFLDCRLLKEQLLTYYAPTRLPVDEQFEQLTDLKMKKGDTVQTYFNAVMEKTERLEVQESQKIAIFKRG